MRRRMPSGRQLPLAGARCGVGAGVVAVMRPGGTPAGSVDLVAYPAGYEATATSAVTLR
jgi:hypothetical protein